MSMTAAFHLRNAAAYVALRCRSSGHCVSTYHSIRKFSILQEFSKKLIGEIDSNPELQKSIKEVRERAEDLKSRTKETTEHLYKHIDAARGKAETRAKQVSSVIKEKLTEASDQVKETVSSVKLQAEKDDASVESSTSSSSSDEKVKEEPNAEAKRDTTSATGGQQPESLSSKVSSCVTSAFKTLEKAKLAGVARDGYNILAEELTGKKRAKSKAAIPRSSVTAVVPVLENKTGWQKRWEELKQKATVHRVFKSFKTVKEHPVVLKTHEIAEDIKERWETSDSPVVHKIQDLNDSVFGETATATAMKEIRNNDYSFSFPDFVMEVQEDIRPVLTAYLKGDFVSLRKKCSKEVVERCRAEHRALQSQGMFVDNKILYISDVEVKETKLVGNVPMIIVAFRTQQNHCVRDEFGHIKEGSKDDISTIYYAWAMQQVPPEEMDPDDCTPRWQLREMQQLGVQAII